MKLTHYEHGTYFATEKRTMRGAAERYVQWKNRTLSHDPGPVQYTHTLGLFSASCHGLFFLVLSGCAAFFTWLGCILDFLPGEIIGALACVFFCACTLYASFIMLKMSCFLLWTKCAKTRIR